MTTYSLGIGNRLDASVTSITNLLFVVGSTDEPIGLDDRWGYLELKSLDLNESVIPSASCNSFYAQVPSIAGTTNTIAVAIRDCAGNMG